MGMLLLLLLGAAAFLGACWLAIRGILTRELRPVKWAVAAGLVGGGCAAGLAIWLAASAYRHGTHLAARLHQRVALRTGEQAYATLFGPPAAGCVAVQQLQDQLVPRLDCCIWLEFRACPGELARILARQPGYQPLTGAARAGVIDQSPYLPAPGWWAPASLGARAVVLRKQLANNPNRDQLLIFSPDSTHAYYCDMAD